MNNLKPAINSQTNNLPSKWSRFKIMINEVIWNARRVLSIDRDTCYRSDFCQIDSKPFSAFEWSTGRQNADRQGQSGAFNVH